MGNFSNDSLEFVGNIDEISLRGRMRGRMEDFADVIMMLMDGDGTTSLGIRVHDDSTFGT